MDYFIKNIYKKSKYIFIILFINPFLILIIIYKIYKKHHFFCIDWDKGLNDSYIDNYSKDYPCRINIPQNNSCFLAEIGPYIDFSSLYRPTCNDTKLILSQRRY